LTSYDKRHYNRVSQKAGIKALTDIVTRLKELQRQRTQAEFAAELEISQGMLSKIYARKRRIGITTARAIVRHYPDLTLPLALFLLSDLASDNVSGAHGA